MDRAELHFRNYPDAQETHSHPHQQILLAAEGRMELEIAGAGGLVHGCQGAIVQSDQSHAYRGVGCNSILVLDVPDTAFGDLHGLRKSGKGQSFFAVPPALHHLVRFLALERQPDGGNPALLERAAPLVISSLASHLESSTLDYPARVNRALVFMHGSYESPIGGRDVADAAGLSVSRLYGLFRPWVGKTPGDYLADLRLAKARELLARTEDSVARIAHAVGYGDQTALTRAFRKRLQTTPAAYRREMRAPQARSAQQ